MLKSHYDMNLVGCDTLRSFNWQTEFRIWRQWNVYCRKSAGAEKSRAWFGGSRAKLRHCDDI